MKRSIAAIFPSRWRTGTEYPPLSKVYILLRSSNLKKKHGVETTKNIKIRSAFRIRHFRRSLGARLCGEDLFFFFSIFSISFLSILGSTGSFHLHSTIIHFQTLGEHLWPGQSYRGEWKGGAPHGVGMQTTASNKYKVRSC